MGCSSDCCCEGRAGEEQLKTFCSCFAASLSRKMDVAAATPTQHKLQKYDSTRSLLFAFFQPGGEAEKLGCCVDCHGSSCTTDSLLELVLEAPGLVFNCLQSLTLAPLTPRRLGNWSTSVRLALNPGL